MTTIHMETEKVHAVAKKLDTDGTQMLASVGQLRSSGSRLRSAWLGGGADDFTSDLNSLIKRIENQIVELQTLSVRVSHEADEWIETDQGSANQIKSDLVRFKKQVEAPRFIPGSIADGDTEYTLIRGRERRAYEGYLEGDLTFKDAVEFIEKDPFEKDYLKSSVTFYKHEQVGKLAWLDGQAATKYGNFTGSVGSIEGSTELKAYYQEGAFRADASAEAGIYAAKVTYGAELAGVSVAAVGFLGAEAQATTGIAFDPAKGEIGAKAELDAFAGGKIEGSISDTVSVAGVDGTISAKGGVSYGVGATAKVDVGFSNGHLRSEIELGATLGLGVEFGINIDLNVQQAATSVWQAGQDAVDWLFH